MSSPGIACISRRNYPRQNENIKGWCGVAYLRRVTEMKENYLYGLPTRFWAFGTNWLILLRIKMGMDP